MNVRPPNVFPARETCADGATLDNADIAELLAQEAEKTTYPLQRAFRRAARRAFLWPEQAADLAAERRCLTELSGIGPYLEKRIRQWLDRPPVIVRPPPERRNFISMATAAALLTKKPAWLHELKGDLQMHTEWSDGSCSVEQMAQAAIERGYQYIAITDHSQGLKIAGGINARELAEQRAEIDAVNEGLNCSGPSSRVLRSIELNLNPQGQGDMPDEALASLDLVVGAFHSALRKTDDQTERYVAALNNPSIQILAHPRGRIFDYRLGLKADWPRVFGTAAALDKAVEIDAYPDRQDLSTELLFVAKKAGCRVSIGTDAHHSWQMDFIILGLAHALLAGIPRSRILNFLTAEQLLGWVAGVREHGGLALAS